VKKPAGITDPGYNRAMGSQKIVVPIMGEGIRNAKVVTLLKKPGDTIALDDPLCEVETDKAVYPIESSFAGTMGEWLTEVGATVDIGQELGTILTEGDAWDEQMEAAAEVSPDRNGDSVTSSPEKSTRVPVQKPASTAIEPALSATIVRKLGRVVPVNLQIDARWDAIRSARELSKKTEGQNAASPSVMVAWAVVRAMEKHAPFRRIILEDDRIEQKDEFDLGIAVALEDDRLATAVVTKAAQRDWPDFLKRYNETVAETRTGRVDAMNAPLVISSLGAFGVRAAAPIVVPPSVATLFVGSAHYETIADGKKTAPAEVITLSLTFDHRVVNGAGAANFVHDVKEQIENFAVPANAGKA
jgi:pyruvate/2-oxoglutarate dehydrogenase complex dihydrolipoamide acyltransferase (E2) component